MRFLSAIPASILLFALFIAAPLAAQDAVPETGTGSSETGSGSQLQEEPVELSIEEIRMQALLKEWDERRERSKDFRLEHLQQEDLMLALRAADDQIRKRRAENRVTCRKDIRKSSKFTKVSTTLRCYRVELGYELDRLQKKREYIEEVPGISDDIRWLTLTRVDLLTDALSVVGTAIDSNLYQSVEEILEARANLLKNYRKPYALMMVRLHADKLLSWTFSVMTRVADITEETDIDPDVKAHLLQTLLCLSEAEDQLSTVISAESFEDATLLLSGAESHLRTCIATIEEIHTIMRSAAEVEEEEEEPEVNQPPISRRLRRRLQEGSVIYGEE